MPDQLSAALSELELTWRSGAGERQYEYYVRARELAQSLISYEQPVGNAAALKLLDAVLAKRASPAEPRESDFAVGAADLIAIRKIASYLLAHDEISASQRRQKIEPLARALGRVRQEWIPNFIPKKVYRNVAPPPAANEVRMAGMNPDAISDPVAREEYKAAIRANNANNLANKRQQELADLERAIAKPLVAYLAKLAAHGETQGVVRKAMDAARLTQAERATIAGSLRR